MSGEPTDEPAMSPKPAEGWPDGPLTEDEARNLLFDREDVTAVWVMDHDETTRSAILGPGASEDAVIDIVLETSEEFRLYSYTDHDGRTQWVTFGNEEKEEGGESMRGTLASYRLLVGESELS